MISAPPSPNKKKLVGGFNPLEKIFSSNWIISPNKGENTIYSKPPPGKKKTQYTADPLAAFPLPNAAATQFAAFAPGAQDCPDRTTLAALACNARPNVRDSGKLIGFESGA